MSAIKSLITGFVLFVVIIFIFIIFFNPLSYPAPPSINDIQNRVIKNEVIFEDAISFIRKKEDNENISESIDHAKYYTPDDSSIKGLFKDSFTNGKSIQTPIENQELEELFLKNGVRHILIYNNCIEFEFEGGGREYYCGAVWTEDGNPVGVDGSFMELTVEGKGWSCIEENGDNKYYIEPIKDNWFVYTMSF